MEIQEGFYVAVLKRSPSVQSLLLRLSADWIKLTHIRRVTCFTQALLIMLSFPHSSVGKESACHARDPGLIPGSGRAAGEGIGYPLQYSWACLEAQLIKNPPAMRETWVQSLDWENPLKKGKATHSSILV